MGGSSHLGQGHGLRSREVRALARAEPATRGRCTVRSRPVGRYGARAERNPGELRTAAAIALRRHDFAALGGTGSIPHSWCVPRLPGLDNWRHDFVSPTGQQERFSLSDGTSIMLNSSAALDVRFTGEARRVVLARGEVFFDVTHNPDLPFIVQAGSGEVRVLGTAFSVRRDGDDLLVTVERGRVQVSSGGHSSIL